MVAIYNYCYHTHIAAILCLYLYLLSFQRAWRERFYAKKKVKAEQAEMLRLLQEQIRIKEEKKKQREAEKFDYKKNGIGNVILNIAQVTCPFYSFVPLIYPCYPLIGFLFANPVSKPPSLPFPHTVQPPLLPMHPRSPPPLPLVSFLLSRAPLRPLSPPTHFPLNPPFPPFVLPPGHFRNRSSTPLHPQSNQLRRPTSRSQTLGFRFRTCENHKFDTQTSIIDDCTRRD